MSEWYGDVELLEEEGWEEAAVSRWEMDAAEMMPEDWEQIMGAPDDRELEWLDEVREEASMAELEQKELKEADREFTVEWDLQAEEKGGEMKSCEGAERSAGAEAILVMSEDDIPF